MSITRSFHMTTYFHERLEQHGFDEEARLGGFIFLANKLEDCGWYHHHGSGDLGGNIADLIGDELTCRSCKATQRYSIPGIRRLTSTPSQT